MIDEGLVNFCCDIHRLQKLVVCRFWNIEKFYNNPLVFCNLDGRNHIRGACHALDWAISHNHEKIKIYHDYEGLSKWISGEWDAKSKVAKMYTSIFEFNFKDFLMIKFAKVPGHSNVIYNYKEKRKPIDCLRKPNDTKVTIFYHDEEAHDRITMNLIRILSKEVLIQKTHRKNPDIEFKYQSNL